MTMDKDTETSEKHTNLRDIEPLRPVDESEPTDKVSSTPEVGVSAEVEGSSPDDDDGLDALRR